MEVWAQTILIGIYVALQLIADISAVKIIDIAGIFVPAGTLVYAVTFTWRDLLHKRLGKRTAQTTIIVAGAANILLSFYLIWVAQLKPAPFWPHNAAFRNIFITVPRIVMASIIAEVICQLTDTEIFHFLLKRISERWQVLRVLISNAVSLFLDSLIFIGLAFGGLMPFVALVTVFQGQTILKGIITVVSLPLIYFVKYSPRGKQLVAN